MKNIHQEVDDAAADRHPDAYMYPNRGLASSNYRTIVKVISVDSAINRRRQFADAAYETTQKWSFLDAHRGLSDKLRVDARAMKRLGGRILTENELGCYSSHYSALFELLSSDSEQMIVLEDDVLVDWSYISFMASYNMSAMGIDYLRLFAKVPGRFRKIQQRFLEPYHHLIQFIGPALGTQAYVVTRRGAELLVESLRTVRRPIDQALDHSKDHSLPNLAVVPFPVIERFVPSSIGEGRFTDKPTGTTKLLKNAIQRVEQVERGLVLFSRKPRIGPPQHW